MTQTAPNYAAMSKADLIAIAETHFALEQRRQQIFKLPNKVMAAGEKLTWLESQYFLASETPNDDELVCIPIGKIADAIGMSEKTVGRYVKNMCERFESPRESLPYKTKAGQEINLTYIKRDDPLWTAPETVELDDEKLRTINGNECPCCHTNNLRIKKRTITSQEIHTCDGCGYKKVTPVSPAKDAHGEDVIPLEPMVYWPEKKASQPDDLPLFSEQKNVSASSYVDTRGGIPEELKALKQWAVYRIEPKKDKDGNILPDKKPDKVPYIARGGFRATPKADCSDPATWETCDQAQEWLERSRQEGWKHPYDGLVFAFKEGGNLVGVDVDRDWGTGQMKDDQALERGQRLNTYGENSPNNGLHYIAHGSIPRNFNNQKLGIEMYDHNRFLTFTGNHIAGTPNTIENRQTELDALFAEVATPAPPPIELVLPARDNDLSEPCRYTHEQVLQKARGAANSEKFCLLYDGRWQEVKDEHGGQRYPSQSEAEAALYAMLRYWADGNVSTMDRLFMDSGLYRAKCERDDYRNRTISRVLGWQVAS